MFTKRYGLSYIDHLSRSSGHADWIPSRQTAAALAITEVRPEDKSELSKLVSTIKEGYSEKYEEAKRHWGGGIMGQKAIARTEKKRKALEVSSRETLQPR